MKILSHKATRSSSCGLKSSSFSMLTAHACTVCVTWAAIMYASSYRAVRADGRRPQNVLVPQRSLSHRRPPHRAVSFATSERHENGRAQFTKKKSYKYYCTYVYIFMFENAGNDIQRTVCIKPAPITNWFLTIFQVLVPALKNGSFDLLAQRKALTWNHCTRFFKNATYAFLLAQCLEVAKNYWKKAHTECARECHLQEKGVEVSQIRATWIRHAGPL